MSRKLTKKQWLGAGAIAFITFGAIGQATKTPSQTAPNDPSRQSSYKSSVATSTPLSAPVPTTDPVLTSVGNLPSPNGYYYASETSHSVTTFAGIYESFGQMHGMGLPLTEPFVEQRDNVTGYWVQYFEKALVEYHPELAGDNQYQLAALGAASLQAKYPDGPPETKALNKGEKYLFAETGHLVEGPFLKRWHEGGEIRRFGYPLTDTFEEASTADGNTYLVQYFERVEMQYHPELPTPQNIQLVALGAERLSQLYGPNVPDNAAAAIPSPTVDTVATTIAARKIDYTTATARAKELQPTYTAIARATSTAIAKQEAANRNSNSTSNSSSSPKSNTTYNASCPAGSSGERYGAICMDGWHSSATGRGACSHHGGVDYWLVCP